MSQHYIEDDHGNRYEVDPRTGDPTPAPEHDGGPLGGLLDILPNMIESVLTRS